MFWKQNNIVTNDPYILVTTSPNDIRTNGMKREYQLKLMGTRQQCFNLHINVRVYYRSGE